MHRLLSSLLPLQRYIMAALICTCTLMLFTV